MSTPGGWYDDPQDPSRLRYWDGVQWTPHLAPKQPPQAQAAGQPAQQHGQQPSSLGQQPGPYGQQYGQPWPPVQQGHPGAAGMVRPGQPAVLPDGTPLASYGSRVGAYLIDGLVLVIPEMLLAGYPLYRAWKPLFDRIRQSVDTGQPMPQSNPLNPYANVDVAWLLVAVLIAAVISYAYFILLHGLRGQTVGKRAVGIAVRRLERPGAPGLGVAAKRMLLNAVVGLFALVPLVGTLMGMVSIVDYIWPLTNDRKQALHDRIAGTVVVRSR